ncbi:MAG: biotin/lipoyl-containing protein, partial [Pseudomonadota bacterium]
SVQRRHQKVVEEAPCPGMTPELRAQMGAVAVEAARAVDYCGAGTVEFLLEPTGAFYFLEMNTRLQVEHPVTEVVTGLDLVALQIAVAQGNILPISQKDVKLTGHAIEVRLYAEDPSNGYLPATGPVDVWQPATGPGIRIDAGIQKKQEVSPFYDPMLAKIIAHGPTREVARARLLKAVKETVLLGTVTNSSFLADVLERTELIEGEVTTTFLDETYPGGFQVPQITGRDAALALALLLDADRTRAKTKAGYVSPDQLGWSSAALPPIRLTLTCRDKDIHAQARARPDSWDVWIDDEAYDISFTSNADGNVRACVNKQTAEAIVHITRDKVQLALGAERLTFWRLRSGAFDEASDANGRVNAPMPGLLIELMTEPGEMVTKGDHLAILEAMKMQHQIRASVDGVVTAVHVEVGQQLNSGDIMIEIEEA